MEAGLGGAVGDAEHPRDPREWQVEIEVQDPDGSGLRLEAGQGTIEEIAIGDLARVVQRFGEVDRREFDLDDAAPALAGEVDAGVRHQAVQPVVERRGITQPRQAAPCPDQGLLDGVLGQLRVAKDEAGRGIQARAGLADELREGVPVASARSPHEFRSVNRRLSASGTTMVAVLASLRRWRGRDWFPHTGPAEGSGALVSVRDAASLPLLTRPTPPA